MQGNYDVSIKKENIMFSQGNNNSLPSDTITSQFNDQLTLQSPNGTISDINQRNNFYFPTLIDAIRRSGGFTTNSQLNNITVTRKNSLSNGGGRKKTILNLLDVLELNDPSQNIRILDGDTIKVDRSENPSLELISKAIKSNINPKLITVSISGRVEQPGPLLINKSSSLNDALLISGVTKALTGKIRFYRFNDYGKMDLREFKYDKKSARGTYKNPFLRNGDIVFVNKGKLSAATEIITEITAPLSGIFQTYGLLKVVTD